jgi:hypothetical protein
MIMTEPLELTFLMEITTTKHMAGSLLTHVPTLSWHMNKLNQEKRGKERNPMLTFRKCK